MKLEELVPPLELCKLIPEGDFEGSAFLWEAVVDMNTGETVNTHTVPRPSRIGCNPFVYREIAKEFHLYPAPTLEEILYNMPPICRFRLLEWRNEKNIAEKILKVWLKLKGIDE